MRRYFDWLIPVLVLVGALALSVKDATVVVQLRNILFDTYQRLEPRPYLPAPVRIVDIDEESLRQIGQWPWPRDTLARLVDRLTQAGAAAIGLDMLLAEPDRTAPLQFLQRWQSFSGIEKLKDTIVGLPDPDEALARALHAGPTIVVFAPAREGGALPACRESLAIQSAGDAEDSDPDKVRRDLMAQLFNYAGIANSLPTFEQAATAVGSVNTEPDSDGVIRRVPLMVAYKDRICGSISAEMLRVAQNAPTYTVKLAGSSGEWNFASRSTGIAALRIGAAVIPINEKAEILLYDSGTQPERFIPAWKVLSDSFDPSLVAGQAILVGASAEGLRDYKPTPLDPVMAGVEIHAQLLEQILNGQYLYRPDYAVGAEWFAIFVLGLAVIVLTRRVGALWTALFGAAAVAAAIGGSWIAFARYHLLFDPIYPSIAVLAVYLSASLLGYLRTEGERRHVRRAFSQYLAPAVVEQVSRNPDLLKLGGELRELTVMFSDIRDFTKIAEKLDPQQLTHLINSILTPLTAAIHARKGTIDKYIGDCIMAFWNAPVPDAGHRRNALLAALDMRVALASTNKHLADEAAKAGRAFTHVGIGIGINSGPCSVGNMGSQQRLAYSALGDTVNLASRLESLTRAYGVEIIVGEDGADGITDMALLEIDRVRVKGRSEPLTIYSLLGAQPDSGFRRLAAAQADFLAAYRRQDWPTATTLIADCLLLDSSLAPLYSVFAARIAHYETEPPMPDWDGVFTATTKTG